MFQPWRPANVPPDEFVFYQPTTQHVDHECKLNAVLIAGTLTGTTTLQRVVYQVVQSELYGRGGHSVGHVRVSGCGPRRR
jgi:hypothetical protein